MDKDKKSVFLSAAGGGLAIPMFGAELLPAGPASYDPWTGAG